MGRSCDDATKARCNDLLRACALAESGLRLPCLALLLACAAVLLVAWCTEWLAELWLLPVVAELACLGFCAAAVDVCASATPLETRAKARNWQKNQFSRRQFRRAPKQSLSLTFATSRLILATQFPCLDFKPKSPAMLRQDNGESESSYATGIADSQNDR
jgi:hypothetical protein